MRGRDIKRYSYDFCDLWLINTHNGIREKQIKPVSIDDYPAIRKHLDNFYPQLEKRLDKGGTPYNLRNCAYIEDFSKQKIVWARLMRVSKNDVNSFPRFSMVSENMFVVDSLCFFVGSNLNYLQAVLNSELAAYYFFNNISILDNGGMQMRQQYVENIPVPQCSNSVITKIEQLLSKITNSENGVESQIKVNELIYQAFNFTDEEVIFIKDFISSKIKEISGVEKQNY